jgi:hypothetical protein
MSRDIDSITQEHDEDRSRNRAVVSTLRDQLATLEESSTSQLEAAQRQSYRLTAELAALKQDRVYESRARIEVEATLEVCTLAYYRLVPP